MHIVYFATNACCGILCDITGKGGVSVAKTEAQRRAIDKWDQANMAYQTIKVRKETLEEFKALVQANGDKVNTVLREAIENYISDHKTT